MIRKELEYMFELINNDTEHNKLYTRDEWTWRRKLMSKIQDKLKK